MTTLRTESPIGQSRVMRSLSVVLSALLIAPLFVACGGGSRQANLPPVDDSSRTSTASQQGNPPQQQVRKGLSTKQKVAILAGAAALYYLYNQHKNRQGQGAQGKYYLSKNGRIYYRDDQGRAHWVTPPREGIQVPEAEAQRYREFEGYNGRQDGRDLNSLPEAQTAQ